jgi:YgiT-type zinc finger domain-containing protein
VTVTLERGAATLVFKDVPARLCENCGEAYLDEAVTTQLLEAATTAYEAGVLVEIRAFAAA